MHEYGIIGYPLTHSFSPAYFHKKFAEGKINASYKAFPLHDIIEFPSLLKQHADLCGLNVTIPYKESVILYLDELDEIAEQVEAVNCIGIIGGRAKGYNTDVIGFEKSLLPLLKPYHKHALILGTGGSSKAVAYVLKKLNISFQKISRHSNGFLTYSELTDKILQEHTLIINTTPLGMFPRTADYPPIPYAALTPLHLLYDLIYNPEETRFLELGKKSGATIKNGFEMLEIQAEESWKIWNNKQ
jgi:shikimate dehydrogenase